MSEYKFHSLTAKAVLFISVFVPSVLFAGDCTVIYYESVPEAFHRMIRGDGTFMKPVDLLSDKTKGKWAPPEMCTVKAVLATDQGEEIESVSLKNSGKKSSEHGELVGKTGTTKFSQPGKFKMMIYEEASNTLIFEQPFEVVQWKPKYFAIKGDWENMGAFVITDEGIKFRFYWTNNTKAEVDNMDKLAEKAGYMVKVVLKYQGKPVAGGELREGFRFEGTEGRDVELSFDKAGGIKVPLKPEHFQGKDGEWLAAVFLGEKVLRKYPFKVSGGKIMPHPRQDPGYNPKTRAIITRTTPDEAGKMPAQYIWVEHKDK